jgi:hypothetical protein
LKIKPSYILSLLLIFTSLNTFGVNGFDFSSTNKNEPSLFSTIDDDKSKGVLPENIPVSPTENTEKEERENTENNDESFKCVFGISQSATHNYFEIIFKRSTKLNYRHACCLPIYDLLHSWKAFLS